MLRRTLTATALVAFLLPALLRAGDAPKGDKDLHSLSACVTLLKEGWYDDRAEAAKALMRMGKDARPAVPALIDAATRDSIFGVRLAAVEALGEIGPEAKEVVPALAGLLRDSNSWEVRLAAAAALHKFGLKAKGAVPALREAAKESNEHVSREAYVALCDLELLYLPGEAKDEDADTRLRAVVELGQLDPASAETAVPALVDSLHDEDVRVRRAAVASLGRFGASAKAAAPHLEAFLAKEEDADVHAAAAAALLAVDSDWDCQLQGKWEIKSILWPKPEAFARAPRPESVTLDGHTLTIKMPGDGPTTVTKIKIDARKKPKWIEILPDGDKEGVGTRCIYEVKGDELRVACYFGLFLLPPPYPGSFSPNDGLMIVNLKRVKK